jgi:hypothetical protein
MPIETGSFINSLNPANPPSNDPKSEGDNHLRFIKEKIVETFPNIDDAVTASPGELNILDGATLDTAELNILDGVTASTAEINLLDGVTATTAEINNIDGVTSPIQPQIDLKAPIASPTLTGTPRAPTGAAGSGGTQIATHDYVNSTILNVSLPGQAGNAGALMQTDGTNANWTKTINGGVVKLLSGGDIVGTTEAQTLTNKTINQKDALFTLQDDVDITKQAKFECSSIATGTTRIITIPNENVTLGEQSKRLLQTFTSTALNFWEILPTTIDNSYDIYEFEFWGVTSTRTAGPETVGMQFKANNAYITTGYAYTSTSWSGTYAYVDDLQATSATSGMYMFGVIKFYMPWSTTFKKFGFITTSNVEGFKDSTSVIGSFGHQTLLPLQGFKFQHFTSGTSLFPTNAVGKWYGLK